MQYQLVEPEVLQVAADLRAKEVGKLNFRAGCRMHENQPRVLGNGEFRQVVLRAVEIRKIIGFGHALELAVEAVSPAMKGTDHGSQLGLLTGNQARSAVLADIQESAQRAFFVSHHHEGQFIPGTQQIGARLAHLGGVADHQRVIAKRRRQFAIQNIRLGIDANRHLDDFSCGFLVAVELAQFEHGFQSFDLSIVFHRRFPPFLFVVNALLADKT